MGLRSSSARWSTRQTVELIHGVEMNRQQLVSLALIAVIGLSIAGCGGGMSKAESDARETLRGMGAMTVLGTSQAHVETCAITSAMNDKLDEAMQCVGKMPYLVHFDASNTNLNDEHMKTVSKLKRVGSMVLSGTSIGDAGIAAIGGHRKVDMIYARNTKITSAAMDTFGGMKQLKVLEVSGDDTLSNLKAVAELPKLEWFLVNDATINDSVVDLLASMPGLVKVTFKSCSIDDGSIDRLKSAKPALNIEVPEAPAPPIAPSEPANGG